MREKLPMLKSRIKHGICNLIRRCTFGVVIFLNHPVNPKPRWSIQAPHAELQKILDSGRSRYKDILESFAQFTSAFLNIKKLKDNCSPKEPFWINGWISGLDGIALYGLISQRKPSKYIEIGSGNSTKFAFKAKMDNSPYTKIISIDPRPRAKIDEICDEVIRKPVEDVELSIFDDLCENDIVFIDNSHRVFTNSDAVVVFLDIIPRLKRGVIVEIHDVTLPYDYPASWAARWFSEQYLLASYLLAKGSRFSILLPATFVSKDNELKNILKPLWANPKMQGVESHGCSFWIQMN